MEIPSSPTLHPRAEAEEEAGAEAEEEVGVRTTIIKDFRARDSSPSEEDGNPEVEEAEARSLTRLPQ